MNQEQTSPTPRVERPAWGDLVRRLSGAYVLCNCRQVLQTSEAVREHWQAGHFDYVVPLSPVEELRPEGFSQQHLVCLQCGERKAVAMLPCRKCGTVGGKFIEYD